MERISDNLYLPRIWWFNETRNPTDYPRGGFAIKLADTPREAMDLEGAFWHTKFHMPTGYRYEREDTVYGLKRIHFAPLISRRWHDYTKVNGRGTKKPPLNFEVIGWLAALDLESRTFRPLFPAVIHTRGLMAADLESAVGAHKISITKLYHGVDEWQYYQTIYIGSHKTPHGKRHVLHYPILKNPVPTELYPGRRVDLETLNRFLDIQMEALIAWKRRDERWNADIGIGAYNDC